MKEYGSTPRKDSDQRSLANGKRNNYKNFKYECIALGNIIEKDNGN
jgi:hypothetical protein